ncbi:glycoside hydrolase family 27 protein [Streptomyces sp. NPDC059785]|uniref:glycoside hydrolase family 27 protein n=1 Tax=Streptomyces sp. NPDC059785 TaxID=3346945 RepID=UPI003646E80A
MTLAPTPPMGWNSWDCYGTSVTEEEVLANAEFMARHLLPHGWDTVVVDIQWYEPAARAGGYNKGAALHLDEHGRPLPAVNRFPSAADGAGFRPLADRVHALGLRFGLHIMRGIPRQAADSGHPALGDIADRTSVCPWNGDNYGLDHGHPGAQDYYDSLGRLLAQWAVDFVKADDMLWPYHEREIASLATALRRSGRPMELSLSPGRTMSLERLEHLRAHATMWRMSDDLWDRWDDVAAQFDRLAAWAPHARPGAWPDADMLPLGRIGIRAERGGDRMSRLTPAEQRTLMSLWCLARSPLMFGGDLPTSPPETIALLTNDALLDVLRHSRGNRQVVRDGGLAVWTAEATDRDARYVGLFNLRDTQLAVRLRTGDLGFRRTATLTDLWTGAPLPNGGPDLAAELAPHACLLLRADRPERDRDTA